MTSVFYNLTFLNKDYDLIKKEITNEKYKIGDMLFIGSTDQTCQEYEFATITEDGLETCDNNAEHLMKNKNISYENVIISINEFWEEFFGDDYFSYRDDSSKVWVCNY